jgi:transcriptional regulator with XRE-family HTH domain
MSKTLDDKQQFIELRAKGYSFSRISEELGISKPTLIDWSRDDDVSSSICNLRALLIDELQEKYTITKKHRIIAFGEFLNRAKSELEKRDLSEISTDKLIPLIIKLSETLKQDEIEVGLIGKESLMPNWGGNTRKWVV